jgi:cytochrome oxidase Cu insertion factor (SCO1/SenC/PrrC family)
MMMRRRRRLMTTGLLAGFMLVLCSGAVTALEVGDKAPDFSLPATTAERVSLADYLGKQHVVVFFYIYAFTNT